MTMDAVPASERRLHLLMSFQTSRAGGPVVRPRADWIGVLDAVYSATPDDATWARELTTALTPVFEASEGVTLMGVTHDANCTRGDLFLIESSWNRGLAAAERERDFSGLGPEGFRAFFYPPIMVSSHSELEVDLSPESAAYIRGARAASGIDDAVGIVVHPAPGVVIVVHSVTTKKIAFTRNDRRTLMQLGLHIENAVRHRRAPGVVRGHLTTDGIVDLDSVAAEVGTSLAAGARRIEAARRSRRGDDGVALDLWHALVAGRYTLVPQQVGGRTRYAVVENTLRAQRVRAFSKREIDVLSLAARGVPSKMVAYGLGLSASAISHALRDAAAKVGATSRLDLLRIAAMLASDPRTNASPATLTEAEQEIFVLLRQGLSNAQIAKHRSRSIRTIANQVASLLRKTKSPSRRAILAGHSA